MVHDDKNPLDYRSPPNSPLDPDVSTLWWVRWANRRRSFRWPLRMVYWLVMLGAIAAVLWYVREMFARYGA